MGIGGVCKYSWADSINLGDLACHYRAEYNWIKGQLQAVILHGSEGTAAIVHNDKLSEPYLEELCLEAAPVIGKKSRVVIMASRFRHLRARTLKAVFQAHALVYEVSDGRIGAWMGLPTLLLSVTGRKSGLTRTTALVYFEDGGNYVVVGSDGAARRDPQWWKNLRVNPQATVRVGRNKFAARACLATGAERERLWQIGTGINPMWAKYQTQTERALPVVVLTPDS